MTEPARKDPRRWDEDLDRIERGIGAAEARKAYLEELRPQLETFCSDCEATFTTPTGQRVLRVLEAFAMRRDPTVTHMSAEQAMKALCRREGFNDLIRFIARAVAGDVDAVLKGP